MTHTPPGHQMVQKSHTQVYVISLNDGKVKQVSHASEALGQLKPLWSPDGTRISYQSYLSPYNIQGKDTIYLINPDGTRQFQLPTTDTDAYYYLAWSPDGTKIAYVSCCVIREVTENSFYEAPQYRISVINADGSNNVVLTNQGLDIRKRSREWNNTYNPVWSRDGKTIFFNSDKGIFSINADGSNQVLLTVQRSTHCTLSLSPDGSKLAFSSSRNRETGIDIMNVDGSNQTKVTHLPDSLEPYFTWYPSNPLWSTDGNKIMFESSSFREESERTGKFSIYTINVDGTSQNCIATSQREYKYPTWSPDGKMIAYCCFTNLGYRLFIMNADGSNNHNLR
jgi:Tol biopolymer transport system component